MILSVFMTLGFLFSSCTSNKLLVQQVDFTAREHDFMESIFQSLDVFYREHHCVNINVLQMIQRKFYSHDRKLKNQLYHHILSTYAVRLANKNVTLKGLHKWRCNMFIIENIKSFEEVSKIINPEVFRYHGFYLIILIDGRIKELQAIFKTMMSKNIVNVYVLYDDEDGMALSTFFPFNDPSNCYNTQPQVINKFRNQKFMTDLVLESKFDNLNKCPIRLTTFPSNVGVMKRNLSDGTYELYGFEMEMINVIADKLNFTLDIQFLDGPDPWGAVHINGTITGVFQDLKAGRTDIGMGDYFLKVHRLKYFDASVAYLNYPIVFIVPPGSRLTAIEKFFRPFEPVVWLLLLFIFSIGIVVIIAIKWKFRFLKNFVFGRGINHPLINMLIILVGLQQPKVPKRNFARFLLIMLIFMCFVFRTIYQGSLYQFLQSDRRHKEVQTIDEMLENNFEICLHESFVDIIMYNPKIQKMKHYIKGGETMDDLMSRSKRTAFVGGRLNLLEYSRSHLDFPYKICPENLITINIVLYFPKNYYLRETLDHKIGRLISTGFIEQWVKMYDNTRLWKKVRIGPKAIKLQHLNGCFYLLFCGYITGITVLIGEIFVHKKNKMRKLSDHLKSQNIKRIGNIM
ncbi:ionotropic receptor 21a-like [Chironomus tepperi]|uniref:ionotropic receptor 21a-like n=1 Tax=Chironomus tepperi TaxID=113505 RepID=UPI00391F7A45